MKMKKLIRSTGRGLAYATAFAAAAYASYVGYTWLRFGQVTEAATPEEQDALLDRFIPVYDIVERHNVHVGAPPDIVFAAACDLDLERSPIIRAIFKTREWIMRGEPDRTQERGGLISQMRAIGWGVLAEVPNREIVMGAVTQPWVANPIFRPLSPAEFVKFHDPDYVKIVWTLRTDPTGPSETVFRTETRAAATDVVARSKFRRYWSLVSPGVMVIRRMLLGLLKTEAEGHSPRI